MIEKIKQALLWIVAPLTLLFGAILYLFTRNKDLEEKLALSQIKTTQEGLKVKQGVTDEEYYKSITDYNNARDEFLSEYYKSNPLARPSNVSGSDSDR